MAKSSSVNPEAYEAYLRGRYYFYDNSRHYFYDNATDTSTDAGKYFEKAIAKDPQYAPAYAGLATYYATHRKEMEKARELAAKALQLDDGVAEAHIAMATVLFRYDWNWVEAGKEFKRGIELAPNDPSCNLLYAMYLGVLGRHDEAISAMKHAVELDPFSQVMNQELVTVLIWADRNDEAAKQAHKSIDLDPSSSYPHFSLAMAYEQLGMYDEAVAEYLESDTLAGVAQSDVANFKQAYKNSGINGYRRKRLEWEKQHDANYFRIAKLYAQLGDTDTAFQWLEKAYQARYLLMPNIKVAPGLRSLHRDPRFADLVRRVGLP